MPLSNQQIMSYARYDKGPACNIGEVCGFDLEKACDIGEVSGFNSEKESYSRSLI